VLCAFSRYKIQDSGYKIQDTELAPCFTGIQDARVPVSQLRPSGRPVFNSVCFQQSAIRTPQSAIGLPLLRRREAMFAVLFPEEFAVKAVRFDKQFFMDAIFHHLAFVDDSDLIGIPRH
jgi:hypothetical protein